MKNYLLLFLLSFSLGYSQETKFELTPKGFTDFVVIPFEGKTQSELYKKALQWVEFTYKNPKEVLKGNVENEYIRFEGVKQNLYCINSMGKHCYNVRYSIEISFKDGKTKFDVITSEFYAPASQYYAGGYSSLQLENSAAFFKNDKLRNSYKYIGEIPDYYNSLVDDFTTFLKSDKNPSQKNDW